MSRLLVSLLAFTLLLAGLAACTSGNGAAIETAAAETMTAGVAQTSVAIQTATAEAEGTRVADLDTAIETAIAGTAEADEIQTAVVATREAAFTPTPLPQLVCFDQAAGFLSATGPLLGRWQDAITVANSTARIALDEPLADMQAIRRDVEQLDAPPCAEQAQAALVASMDHTIEAFLLFMQEATNARINAEFEESTNEMNNFIDIVGGIIAEATRSPTD